MVQSTANEWMHILSEVLQKALDHGGYVPERNPLTSPIRDFSEHSRAFPADPS
jgi:hypothetical protein